MGKNSQRISQMLGFSSLKNTLHLESASRDNDPNICLNLYLEQGTRLYEFSHSRYITSNYLLLKQFTSLDRFNLGKFDNRCHNAIV